MRNSTHNELKLKRQLRPKDYAESETVKLIDPQTGKKRKIPTLLFEEARSRGLI